MQYNKNKFNDYLRNYLDIRQRIDNTKKTINELIEDEKLKETLSFYSDLDDVNKKRFDRINCNNDYVRYKLNRRILIELNGGLLNLYKDFIESDAFPFSKDDYHFFVSSDTYLVDAITDIDSSKLTKEENILLSDSITSVYKYNPTDYSNDDIPLIKVLYLKDKDVYKTYETLCSAIKSDIRVIKTLDEKGRNICSLDTYQYKDMWKIDHFINKLSIQEQRILNSNSKYKDLLLFSIRSAFYELELLSGTRVTEILGYLENMDIVNQHQERKKEYEIDALIKAYYNLCDINFRENSNYFSGDDYIFAKFETANPKVNERILKMKRR
ncbi:MAG TPA: hypothetical protein IAB38_04375 [Candidatus Onthousia excrementipullorum]|uniref:Uncharacterized protein n=1 Tax=Candidatus Onthousia excrementipullorum TaxID=2840884 RepID=A0A9D1DUR5_9FIRM|nr:hypothetical protein [Candidatus Onthousia excrementipullorum]